MTENIKRAWLLSLLALIIGGHAVAADEKDWYLELEAMPGYSSNYFFRGGRAPAPDTYLFSLYALGEKEKKSGKGKFTFGWDVGQVWVLDIDNADYFDFNVGLEYQRGASKWQGAFFHRPNQVFEEEGLGVFYDLTGVELGLRQGLRPGLWVGFSWEYEQQDYDRVEDLRDANVNTLDLSLRYPLSERWGLRGTLVYEAKDANAGRYSNNGAGAALALEGQPSDRVQLFARYKYRQRNYDDAQLDDRNFERKDDVQDIIFNITWRFTQRWGVRLEDFYRTGSSTRPDRNYSGNRIYAGIVYRL